MEYLYMHVYHGFIHNSQELKVTQMSDRRMDKEHVLYKHNRILYSLI